MGKKDNYGDDMQTLGDRIRVLREGRSLTQEELAAMIDKASPAVVSHYENGRRDPSLSALRKLCAALRCDATLLLGTEPLPDLATCPYCHGCMSEIAGDETDDARYPKSYYAYCGHCGARGPLAGYAADAMTLARCRGNALQLAQRFDREEDVDACQHRK